MFGVGTGTNIDQAAVRAIVAGLNRKTRVKERILRADEFWPFL
jgi:hypothetical protein